MSLTATRPKPLYGKPCNNCGRCCLAEQCPLSMIVFGRRTVCPALGQAADGALVCALPTEPERWMEMPAEIRPAVREACAIAIGGVLPYDAPAGTVQGESFPTNGRFAVADPRREQWGSGQAGVVAWNEHAPTLTSQRSTLQGSFSVADPRVDGHAKSVQLGVRPWDQPAAVVKGDVSVGTGPYAVSDPRVGQDGPRFSNAYRIVAFDEPARAVTGQGGNSMAAVADPRAHGLAANGRGVSGQGVNFVDHYGVLGWAETSRTVSGAAGIDNGRWSVADPRPVEPQPLLVLPSAKDRLVCVIRALDGTWHRPFTTLELAALQSFFDPEEAFAFHRDPSAPAFAFTLEGKSDSAWRERIGNAVPRAAAKAIASTMGRTLLLAWSGETFMLSTDAIWVSPLEVALSLDSRQPGLDEILAMEDAA